MNRAEAQQAADVGELAAALLAEPQPLGEAIDYAIQIERLECTLWHDAVICHHLRKGWLRVPSRQ
jgi:hypothetical protein